MRPSYCRYYQQLKIQRASTASTASTAPIASIASIASLIVPKPVPRPLLLQSSSDEECSSSDDEPEELESLQTFPTQYSECVVRQAPGALTCGLHCIQNLYGRHSVTKQEMDLCAQTLEQKAFGATMYDPKLGFYSMEVLKAVLEQKNKHVQRIDIQKIPVEYFLPTVVLNTSLVGFIVALGSGDSRHYLAIRYNATQRRFRRLDSLPNVRPIDISANALFQPRPDGHIYCSMDYDTQPISALMAVGQSDFLEYRLLHDTWQTPLRSVFNITSMITHVLQGNKRVVMNRVRQLPDVQQQELKIWYNTWPVLVQLTNAGAGRQRSTPSPTCYEFLQTFLQERLKPEKDIVVQLYNNANATEQVQTIIRCTDVYSLLWELREMNWITTDSEFWMTRGDQVTVRDDYGDEINISSAGAFEDYNIDPAVPLSIHSNRNAVMASVGGFYSFQYKVEGTCIGQQHNAYSIKDKEGKVHILYKSAITAIATQTK